MLDKCCFNCAMQPRSQKPHICSFVNSLHHSAEYGKRKDHFSAGYRKDLKKLLNFFFFLSSFNRKCFAVIHGTAVNQTRFRAASVTEKASSRHKHCNQERKIVGKCRGHNALSTFSQQRRTCPISFSGNENPILRIDPTPLADKTT